MNRNHDGCMFMFHLYSWLSLNVYGRSMYKVIYDMVTLYLDLSMDHISIKFRSMNRSHAGCMFMLNLHAGLSLNVYAWSIYEVSYAMVTLYIGLSVTTSQLNLLVWTGVITGVCLCSIYIQGYLWIFRVDLYTRLSMLWSLFI